MAILHWLLFTVFQTKKLRTTLWKLLQLTRKRTYCWCWLYAKHNSWDSRTNILRGKVLEQTIRELSLDIISSGGEPTYWLSAQEKTPDLLDFAIIKGLHKRQFTAQSCLDLISDHSPILIDYSSKPMYINRTNHLYNNSTNWIQFKKHLEANINCNILLKTPEQIELAIINFTDITTSEKRYKISILPDIYTAENQVEKQNKKFRQGHKTRYNKAD